MKPLIMPTVNLNGTAKDDLIRQQLHVMLALDKALEVMGQAMPHGRDYLPSPLDGERKDADARDAWRERMKLVKDLKDEIGRHAFSIDNDVNLNVTHAPGYVPSVDDFS
jgi:hypothetical protein